MTRLILAAAAVALFTGSALATECTEELRDARSEELFETLEKHPPKDGAFERYIEEVEAEYGGREPTDEEACEAIDKLIAKVIAGE